MKAKTALIMALMAATAVYLTAGCGKSPYPPEVDKALEKAGDNRGQLEATLTHYLDGNDSLKIEAAFFLIGNMDEHGYVVYRFVDSSGEKVEFDVLDYPDYETLLATVDSIEDVRGELDYEKEEKIYDLETITSDFLIDQIDYAFRAWREKPWAAGLSFEDFRDYVLPYRGSSEPLEPWREHFWNEFSGMENEMDTPSDPMKAASIINDEIISWFKFDPRFYYHPTDQGLSEMMENKRGRCEDMTNLTIYAMRANGLAVTSDYTPHWADHGNNHAWNAVVLPGGEAVPFMGAESNPGEYQLQYKFAKVYRKTFANQPDNLAFQERKQEEVPGWLAGKSYVDVTAAYTDVCDVRLDLDRDIPDSVNTAYLCVFNSGEWRAIHWGWIINGIALFTDMAPDIAYLPALYLNEEIVPFGFPFILNDDCSLKTLRPDTGRTVSASLISTVPRKKEASSGKSFLENGRNYELLYMTNEGWQSLGKQTAEKKPLAFDSIPASGLYRLVADDSDDEERIFTLENGRQVWW